MENTLLTFFTKPQIEDLARYMRALVLYPGENEPNQEQVMDQEPFMKTFGHMKYILGELTRAEVTKEDLESIFKEYTERLEENPLTPTEFNSWVVGSFGEDIIHKINCLPKKVPFSIYF